MKDSEVFLIQAENEELKKELQDAKKRTLSLLAQVKQLQQENLSLKEELEELRHNGTKREKSKSWLDRYQKVSDLARAGVTPKEGMRMLNMPSTTYFRYLKLYRESIKEQDD